MSGLILQALQAALYSRLSGDTALGAMISGVYDYVPDHTNYPYVTLGDATSRDWSTTTTAGADTQCMLHVYSRSGGRKEALLIMERLHLLLHGVALTISGHHCVSLRHNASSVQLEADGMTYQGRMQFNLLSEKE